MYPALPLRLCIQFPCRQFNDEIEFNTDACVFCNIDVVENEVFDVFFQSYDIRHISICAS